MIAIAFTEDNTGNERLKALEMLLKHKGNESAEKRDLAASAKRMLASIAAMKDRQKHLKKNEDTVMGESSDL